MSDPRRNVLPVAFATELPPEESTVKAHSEHRPVGDIVRTDGQFRVVSEYQPAGDQPAAIDDLERRVRTGERDVVLLGATGTGKSATTAWLVERLQRPTLVMAPNKTLAAQLANELKELFPHNAVEYFVSYYDYYQPEAYVPRSDTYIEKESSVNEAIDRMRHSATRALLERDDVIIVASVSCLYGIGSVETYSAMIFDLKKGESVDQREIIRKLVDDPGDQPFGRLVCPRVDPLHALGRAEVEAKHLRLVERFAGILE